MAASTEPSQELTQSEPTVLCVTPGTNSSQTDSQDSNVSAGTKTDDDADEVPIHIA